MGRSKEAKINSLTRVITDGLELDASLGIVESGSCFHGIVAALMKGGLSKEAAIKRAKDLEKNAGLTRGG